MTERLTDNTLILPLFHQMSESEQARRALAAWIESKGIRLKGRKQKKR